MTVAAMGRVVKAPIANSVKATGLRASGRTWSASRSPIPTPAMPRVAAMKASSGIDKSRVRMASPPFQSRAGKTGDAAARSGQRCPQTCPRPFSSVREVAYLLMNFFERQERARRNSRLIVVLFVVAMVCIVLAMDLAATIIWYFTRLYVDRPLQGPPRWLHIAVMGGTVTVILLASIRKSIEMQAGGGIAVARMMDARQIVPVNAALLERRLLNFVQEMAIAAGTPLPPGF